MLIRPRVQRRSALDVFANFGVVQNVTASQSVGAQQNYGVFTNLGASGAVTLTLPTPVVNMEYTFICAAAQDFVLDVGGSVQIFIGETLGAAGGGATCPAAGRGSSLTLKAISTTLWVATSNVGSWTNP